jgi:hypothetical protein
MTKFQTELQTNNFEGKLRLFASSLGGILKELLKVVGKEMIAETKSKTTFSNRTGKLFNSINFIVTTEGGVFTTRKNLNKTNVYYARFVEKDRNIKPKKAKYLTFKINGQWKKVSSVRVRGRPFITPVFEEYWGNGNNKGYQALASALEEKMENYLR